MNKTTTPADAEAWADAQVQRHRRAGWPLDILGTGPRCTGMCRQGRALCVHPVECGVQRPVVEAAPAPAEASTEIGSEALSEPTRLDIALLWLSEPRHFWPLVGAGYFALIGWLLNR